MVTTNIQQWQAIGRRKRAVARVFLRLGEGSVTVNQQPAADYFGRKTLTMNLMQPLEITELEKNFDILINVCGGGKAGQADAVKHGLARALELFDAKLRSPLKKAGFLTRDPREVERKKYGRPGARKRFQFSKR